MEFYRSKPTMILVMEEKLAEQGVKVEIEPLSRGTAFREQKPITYGKTQQTFAAAVVCLLAFMFGNSVGWQSPVELLLRSSDNPLGKPMTDDEISWLGSLTFLGGMAGTFVWSRIADAYGRKVAGYTASIPFIIGWSLIVFSSSKILLYVAKFANGFAGSGSFILCPLYIGEIVQDTIRGTLSCFVILWLNCGIVVAYCLGATYSYRIFSAICLTIPLAFIVLFYTLPESPTYLWLKGKQEEAEKSLLWLRAGHILIVQEEISNYSNKKEEKSSITYASLFETRGKRVGMLIGFGLFSWQQFCGIIAILTYTTRIFEEAKTSVSSDVATVAVGLFQLAGTFISSVIVDRSGRRILLLISYLSMGLSLTFVGLYFFLKVQGLDMRCYGWVPIATLSVHVITYALGAGPIPYVVLNETLPPDIRGLATSIIILWGTLLVFISVKIFPILESVGGMHGPMWFFSFFCYLGFIFTWSIVPETKGIPLHKILKKLNMKSQDEDIQVAGESNEASSDLK